MPNASISSTPKPKKAKTSKALTQEEIALRAYHIYLERKGRPGDPHSDWLRAEQELLAEKTKKPKARTKSKVTPIAA